MNKSFLVTGGAGFIGSSVAKRLSDAGNRVVTIDNLSTGYRECVPDNVTFIEGGCEDREVIDSLGDERFDAIFHIAGQSSGEISFDNPVYDLQTNAQSTLLLLEHAKKIQCPEVIYASTMSVHGRYPDHPADESLDLRPISFYAVGKIASEHYLRIYSSFGIRTTSLRLFNVYGPGQNLANLRQGMISIFLAQALKNGHIHVKGSPDRYRDHVYIDDVADAFIKCHGRDGNPYECLNIGTGVRTTVGELVDLISEILPAEISVKFEGNTPGDMFGIYSNSSRSSRVIGWEAQVELREGLKNMVKWAQSLDG